MRKLVYDTYAGTYATLAEVKATGLPFSARVVDLPEKPAPMTEKQVARRKTVR